MATNLNQNKLPSSHPTTVTWIAISAVLAIIALYLAWIFLIAEPTIMR